MNIEIFSEEINKVFENCGLKLSKAEVNNFYKYMCNLVEWNEKINLTAITEPKEIITKHFVDSVIIHKYIKGERVLDIGSGAGFPGIPLRIYDENLDILLVDAVNKKVNFMLDTIEKLKLSNITAIHERAEKLAIDNKYRETYDIVVSRAVANMTTLIEYMLPFVKIGGKCICLKGPNMEDELEEAKKAINILGGRIEQIEKYNVLDNERTCIIIVKEKSTPKGYPRQLGKPSKEPLK